MTDKEQFGEVCLVIMLIEEKRSDHIPEAKMGAVVGELMKLDRRHYDGIVSYVYSLIRFYFISKDKYKQTKEKVDYAPNSRRLQNGNHP